MVPTVLTGVDGEPPVFVSALVADTAEAAIAWARSEGFIADEDVPRAVEKILMRELDPIACRARGVDHPWYVRCTPRARNPIEMWEIDG